MEMDKVKLTTRTGRARIESRFDWGQTVWFLSGKHITEGKVIGLRGSEDMVSYSDDPEITLIIEVVAGQLAAKFEKPEEDCFESREALIKEIIGE